MIVVFFCMIFMEHQTRVLNLHKRKKKREIGVTKRVRFHKCFPTGCAIRRHFFKSVKQAKVTSKREECSTKQVFSDSDKLGWRKQFSETFLIFTQLVLVPSKKVKKQIKSQNAKPRNSCKKNQSQVFLFAYQLQLNLRTNWGRIEVDFGFAYILLVRKQKIQWDKRSKLQISFFFNQKRQR